MRILLTGGAGRIGSAVARLLVAAGHDILASDTLYRHGLPCPLELADLRDPMAAYPLLRGCDAVIHLANHPNAHALRPSQTILAENTTMNINLFTAAIELGVQRIVFVSSVQVFRAIPVQTDRSCGAWGCRFPYLPLDGRVPANTAYNVYAMSKAYGEQMLEVMAANHPDLAAVVVRMPRVVMDRDSHRERLLEPLQPRDHRLSEALTYLSVVDAGAVLEACARRMEPGYRVVFPAQSLAIQGMDWQAAAAELLPHVPVTGELGGDGGWVDLSTLREDFGWSPADPPLTISRG